MNQGRDLAAIARSVERAGRLCDGLLKIGPFGLGVEAILDWIPGLGEIFTVAAAAYILGQGAKARVGAPLLMLCGGLMGARTLIVAIPGAGPPIADLLALHRLSAHLIARAIKRKIDKASGEPRRRPFRRWSFASA
ncbi:MAG: DUF4112 domain-containing protein [Caulobacteraceae bacterium]